MKRQTVRVGTWQNAQRVESGKMATWLDKKMLKEFQESSSCCCWLSGGDRFLCHHEL